MASVTLDGVAKAFGGSPVLRGVSLSIAHGSFVGLLGPSGCGKTTLLRILAGLERADAGSVLIGGRDTTHLAPEARNIAMMFQSYALLPHLDVAGNVRFPLRMRGGGTRREQVRRVTEALGLVRLEHLARRMPRHLSGGQQQRVALARAIVSDPDVLLLDEPLSNLDARLREDMQIELRALHRRLGLTTLFVTHDQDEALGLSDVVVLMNKGRIEQVGTPRSLYDAPRTAFVADFIGAANLVPVVVEHRPAGTHAVLPGGAKLTVDGTGRPAGPGLLALRQEDLSVAARTGAEGGGLEAEVEAQVFLGGRTRYVLRCGGTALKAVMPGTASFAPGSPVSLVIAPGRARLVDP